MRRKTTPRIGLLAGKRGRRLRAWKLVIRPGAKRRWTSCLRADTGALLFSLLLDAGGLGVRRGFRGACRPSPMNGIGLQADARCATGGEIVEQTRLRGHVFTSPQSSLSRSGGSTGQYRFSVKNAPLTVAVNLYPNLRPAREKEWIEALLKCWRARFGKSSPPGRSAPTGRVLADDLCLREQVKWV